MRNNPITILISAAVFFVMLLSLAPPAAFAHCDGLDGPVVTAARKALDIGDVNLVLIWAQKENEPEIKAAFQITLEVRKLNAQARDLSDMYFFETLVRIHRAGEGAPYTGLKPAGRDLGPAIPAGDKALETGSNDALSKLLTDTLHKQLDKYFQKAVTAGKYSKDNVEAGRRYVKAYAEYIHYVEQAYDAAKNPPGIHSHEAEAANTHNEED